MRFATVFATASGLAATTFAAPAAEPVPVCNDLPYRPGPYQGRPGNGGDRPTTAATLNFPATCTAIVTSVATSTVVVTEAETYISTPASTTLPIPGLEQPKCVTDEDADSIATVFQLLIQEYSDELALAALTEDFVDWSSAVNILMNGGAQFPKNITGPTFAGRQAFMDGQGSQPQIPFTKLNTFHGCDSMSLRWMTERSANGQKTEVAAIPVIGNAIIEVVPAEEGNIYNFRIKNLYSEFNAAAWLVNLGVFTPAGPVNYFNTTNATMTKRAISYDPSLRGAMI